MNNTVTRESLAERIAAILTEAGYRCRVWSKGTAVRVYAGDNYIDVRATDDVRFNGSAGNWWQPIKALETAGIPVTRS